MEEFEARPGVEFGALVAEKGAGYSLPVEVADEKLEPRGIAMVETWTSRSCSRGISNAKMPDGVPLAALTEMFDSFDSSVFGVVGRAVATQHHKRLARWLQSAVMSGEERLELFLRMLSRHNLQPGEAPAEEPQKLDEQAIEHFLAVLDGGALDHRASEWGTMALRGGTGIVTGCEVLLRDIVGAVDDEDEAAANKLGRPCGAMIQAGTMAYKCLECGSDPTCIMCAACFKNSPCVGHAFRLVRSGGGSCDCGDKDAWKPESFCKAHSQCSLSSAPAQSEKGLAARAYVRKVFTASCAPLVKSEVYMNNEAAEVVFAWWVEACTTSATMREGVADAMAFANREDASSPSLLTWCFTSFHRFSTKAQEVLQTLIFGLLVVYDFKVHLGDVFAFKYNGMFAPQHGLRRKVDLAQLSVQVFTVPAIAEDLVANKRLFDSVLGSILHLFETAAAAMPGDECVSLSHDAIARMQYSRAVTDLEYLLRHRHVAAHIINPSLRGPTGETPFDLLLKCVRTLNMVDTSQRQTSSHVLFESNSWKKAFQVVYRFMPIVDLSCSGLCHDDGSIKPKEASMALAAAAKHLSSWMTNRGMARIIRGRGGGWRGGDWGSFDLLKHPSSFHIPLHRIWARVCVEMLCAKPQVIPGGAGGAEGGVEGMGWYEAVIEHPLRVIALSAHVNSRLWVRNGFTAQNQAYNYSRAPFAHRGRDLDVLTMQLCAAHMPDTSSLVHLLVDRFAVWDFFEIDGVAPPPGQRGQIEAEELITCAEEMVRLLITLVSAREFVGELTLSQRLDLCLVHLLAGAESKKHSSIMEWVGCSPACLKDDSIPHSLVDESLGRVADRGSGGAYSLKASMQGSVSLHSIVLRTRQEQSQVEALLSGRESGATEGRVAWWHIPRSMQPPLAPGLEAIDSILVCRASVRLVYSSVRNAAREGGGRGERKGEVRGSALMLRESLLLLVKGLEAHLAGVKPKGGEEEGGGGGGDVEMGEEEEECGLRGAKPLKGRAPWGQSSDGDVDMLMSPGAGGQMLRGAGYHFLESPTKDGGSDTEGEEDEEGMQQEGVDTPAEALLNLHPGGRYPRNSFLLSPPPEDGPGPRGSGFIDLLCETQPMGGTSLVQELVKLRGVLSMDHEYGCKDAVGKIVAWLATVDERCAALGGFGGEEAGTKAEEEAEKERRKKLAAERQKAMLENMRKQQAEAAANHQCLMNLSDDDDEDEAMYSQESPAHACGWRDPLEDFEGSTCSLCSEAMTAKGGEWMRLETSTREWTEFGDKANGEMEEAYGDGLQGVEIMVGGATFDVDFNRMVVSGPTGTRARPREEEIRRVVKRLELVGLTGKSEGGGGGVSVCGHAFHGTCLERYMASLTARRAQVVHGASFEDENGIDIDQGELVCPLCRRVSNVLLPVQHVAPLLPQGGSGALLLPAPKHLLDGWKVPPETTAMAARENTLRAYDALGRSARREISEELLRAFRDQLRFEEETGRGKEGGGCTKEGMVLLSCMRHHAHAGGVLMQGHAKYMKEVLVWLRRESGEEGRGEGGSAGGEEWQPPTGDGGEEEGRWMRAGELEPGSELCTGKAIEAKHGWRVGAGAGVSSLLATDPLIIACCLLVHTPPEGADVWEAIGIVYALGVVQALVAIHGEAKRRDVKADSSSKAVVKGMCKTCGEPVMSNQQRTKTPCGTHYVHMLDSNGIGCPPAVPQDVTVEWLCTRVEAALGSVGGEAAWAQVPTEILGTGGKAMGVGAAVGHLCMPLMRSLYLLLHVSGCVERLSLDASAPWEEEYSALCRLLRVPPLLPGGTIAPNGSLLHSLARAWIKPRTAAAGTPEDSQGAAPAPGVWGMNELRPYAPLSLLRPPNVFQDLVHFQLDARLASNGNAVTYPCVCLSCGALLASGNDWQGRGASGRRGGCMMHAASCGSGQGAFLLLFEGSIMLVHGNWRKLHGSPYLDTYGEEDVGMVRGARLTLDEGVWASVNSLWRTQNLRWNGAGRWIRHPI